MIRLRANKNLTGIIKHYRSLVVTNVVTLLLASLIGFPSTPAVAGFKLHNSTETAASGKNYWGGWGIAGKQYGAFTCSTCHQPDAPNIKTIRGVITTPDGTAWQSKGFRNVTAVFQNVTGLGSRTESGRTKSYRICEACHSQTAHHRYDTTGQAVQTAHYNGAAEANQCVSCHGHDKGFVAVCTTCHGNPPTSNSNMVTLPAATNALGGSVFNAHSTHTKTKNLSCAVCHNGSTSAGMGQAPGAIEMGFAINPSNWTRYINTNANVTYGSFSGNSNVGGTGYTWSAAGSPGTNIIATAGNTRTSCNVYCHGGWTNSGRKINPSWIIGGGAQTACNNCHAATNANPPTTGTHTKHAATYSVSCTTCHPGRFAGDDHVKGVVHWRFSTLNPRVGGGAIYTRALTNSGSGLASGASGLAGRTDAAGGTCGTILCHSNGRALGTPQYVTPTWGGTNPATDQCLWCHGGRDGVGNAAKSYINNFGLSTTHYQHLGKYPLANINCQLCHSKTAASNTALKQYTGVIRHTNGVRDVTFGSATYYGSYTSYKSTEVGSGGSTRKCENTACHGGKTRNSWSNTTVNNYNTCVHCHGVATTSAALPNNAANRKNFAPGWNKQGTDTDQSNSRQAVKTGAHFRHLSSSYMRNIKCNECHVVPNAPFDAGHMAQPRYLSTTLRFDQASTATVSIGVATGSKPTVLASFGGYTSSLNNAKAATCSSVYCHGNRMKTGTTSGSYKKPYWNYSGMINLTDSVNRCTRCHASPPLDGTAGAGHIGKNFPASCQQCHGTVVDTNGNIINKALHINGIVNASGCTSCHGYPPKSAADPLATPATGATGGVFGAHSTHYNVNKMACVVCHNGYTKRTMGNRSIDMGFALNSTNWKKFNGPTPVTYGNFSGYNALTNSYAYSSISSVGTSVNTMANTRNSCSVYCHGGWTNSGKKLNPSWIGAAQVACGNCHAATQATPPTTGSHSLHVPLTTNGISCTTCHAGRIAGVPHVKGAVQIKFSTAMPRVTNATYTRTLSQTGSAAANFFSGLAGRTNATGGTCGGNYKCHSNGRTVPQYNSPQWGTSTSDCRACHGGRASAMGGYSASTDGFKLSTTHSQHLGKYPATKINCQMCHSKTVMTNAWTLKTYTAASRHANGVKDVVFTDIAYGSYTSYKTATKKCANVSCHGGITRNVWTENGATNNNNTCVHCHGVSGILPANTNRNNYAPGWNNTGISTDGNTSRQDPRVGAHFKHLSSIFMKKLKCNECHTVPSDPFDSGHFDAPRYNSVTLRFDQASTAKWNAANSTTLATFTGYTAGTAIKATTCSSVYCHGNRLKSGDTAGTYRKPYWNFSGMTNNTILATTCSRCHGAPPNVLTSAHTGATLSGAKPCSQCHYNTVDAIGNIINKSMHLNGTVEAPGAACSDCHGATQNAGISGYTRRIVTGASGDFVKLSRHVSDGTATEIVTKWDCVVCHMEGDTASGGLTANHHGATDLSGLINLRNVDSYTTGWAINNRAMDETMRTNMDNFCVNCHDSDGASTINVNATNSGLNVGAATRALSPWNTNDGMSKSYAGTPTKTNGRDLMTTRTRVIDVKSQFYAGSGTGASYNGNASQHAVLGPRYWTNSTAAWGSTTTAWVSNVLRNGTNVQTIREKARLHCSDCHLSETNAHGATNAWHMLLNGTANDYTTDAAGVTTGVCIRCHSGYTTSTNGSRFPHAADSRPMGSAYGSAKMGSGCQYCHAGDGFGNIHGVGGAGTTSYLPNVSGGTAYTPGTAYNAATSYSRYRFLPGAWMGVKPGTTNTDAAFSNTETATCYFPTSGANTTAWGACTTHSAGTMAPGNMNYGRAPKY